MVRIVILGGGFGGIRCALDLSRRLGSEADVVIIDKRSYHVFTPALYEVASAYRELQDDPSLNLRRAVSISYDEIFTGTSVRHVQGEIAYADFEARLVYLKHGKEISYDYCVIALGSESTDYGIPGVRQNAHFFKNIEDALFINKRIYSLFNSYLNSSRDKNIQISMAGAGFTGVELASELAMCLYKLGRMHGIQKKFFSIMMFEASPQMLPMLKSSERKTLMNRLTKIGVGITDHSPIEEVRSDSVKLADGHIWKSDLIIWTAGIKPHSLLERMELPLSQRKKIEVSETLLVKNSRNLFAVGDLIDYINPATQQPVPALAYTAIQQAKLVAFNIVNSIKGRPLHVYKPSANSWAIPVGGKYALVQINTSMWTSGLGGWIIRLWIDLKYFISILSFRKAISLFKKEMIIFNKNDERPVV